jgi:hypothetical protein
MSSDQENPYSSLPAYQPAASGSTPPSAGSPAGPPPTLVRIAFWLFIGAAAVRLITLVFTIATISTARVALAHQAALQGRNLTPSELNAALAVGIVVALFVGLVLIAAQVVFAIFVLRGANWARWVVTVLAAISLFSILSTFGLGALLTAASVVAAVLIWLTPSNNWFRAVKASKVAARG